MRIGIDARMYGSQYTGIGNVAKNLTYELFRLDAKNDYVMFMLPEEFGNFRLPTDRVTKVEVNAKRFSYAEQLSLPWEFLKQRVDLMHFPDFVTPIFYPGKFIATIHDITSVFFPGPRQAKSRFYRFTFRTIFKNTLRKAKKIIAVSRYTKEDLIRHFKIKSDKIAVIYNGVSERFRVIDNRDIINKIKQTYNISKPFIFYVGQQVPHKNIHGLVKAFRRLVENKKLDIELLIGGKPSSWYFELYQTLDDLPKEIRKRIYSPGFIPDEDLIALYNAASVFCLPSFYEGFGMSVLEAMKCGTPVVASNLTSIPEACGNAALYFNPNNIDEMAERLYQGLTDKGFRKELRQEGFRQSEKFSWKKAARKVLEVYNEV